MKKFLIYFTIISLFFLGAGTTLADTATQIQQQIDAHNSSIKQLQDEIDQYQVQLNQTSAEASNLQSTVKALDLNSKKLSTDIKVTETANLAGAVNFGRLLLKATNQKHLVVDTDQRLAINISEPTFLRLFDGLRLLNGLRGGRFRRLFIHHTSRARIFSTYTGGLWRTFSHFVV